MRASATPVQAPGSAASGPLPGSSPSIPPVRLRLPRPYHLGRTLACGQVFRWVERDGWAVGVADGRVWRVRQVGGWLEVAAPSGDPALPALARHLGLDAPLAAVERTLVRDPVLRRVLPYTSGIALMRQDLWECLVSFVISAFNNIPKIRLSVEALARRFGRPLGEGHFAFPEPGRLTEAPLRSLRACVLGYRAPYVQALARLVADGQVDLRALPSLPYAQAREQLLALPGVGEKVAECVLLFALGHGEAFPVDVWVERAVRRAYPAAPATLRGIRAWAQERFGPLAGYANQHLFMGGRSSLI
ncbi:MAG: DNA glycosylase [Armatimonadota bacterium]|nr:DNA glycosylase [Armatimonadota bacterium]